MDDPTVLSVLLAYTTVIHLETHALEFPGAPRYRRGGRNCCGTNAKGEETLVDPARIFARY